MSPDQHRILTAIGEELDVAGLPLGCVRSAGETDASFRDKLISEARKAERAAGPVAEIVRREHYDDGSPNPCNSLRWFGVDAENDFPAGTKLYAALPSQSARIAELEKVMAFTQQFLRSRETLDSTDRLVLLNSINATLL